MSIDQYAWFNTGAAMFSLCQILAARQSLDENRFKTVLRGNTWAMILFWMISSTVWLVLDIGK